jgi:hypothetical protein
MGIRLALEIYGEWQRHSECYFQLKRLLLPHPEEAGSDDFLLSTLPQIGHAFLLESGLPSKVLPHLLQVYFSSDMTLSPPYYCSAYFKYKLPGEVLQLPPGDAGILPA